MINVVETRRITLPRGGELVVDVLPGFYDHVRKQFNLSSSERPSDDHVRMFYFGAVKNAVDKDER